MVHKRPLCLFAALCFALVTGGSAADVTQQRSDFVAAEKALQRNQDGEFERLRRRLVDYPLYPYLEYQALLKQLDRASNATVEDFIGRHQSSPLAYLVRAKWLDRLAARKQWKDYLAFYEPTRDAESRCHRLQALIATGRQAQAFTEVPDLWLHGRSRPNACDPVFDAWTRAGQRTDELVWQRIELAVEAGQLRLARYLGRALPKADQAWVQRWLMLYDTPSRADDRDNFETAHPFRETMLAHAVRRQALHDGLEAVELWHRIKPLYPFNAEQVERTEHMIVRNLARTPGDVAYRFVRGVAVDADDLPVHEARIKAALLREDWAQVVRWVAALPKGERDDERWRYWLARALEGIGDTKAADALYTQVAGERTYYGFLAADRVGQEYHLNHAQTPVSESLLTEVAELPAVQRAAELYALERWTDAHREWRIATRDMDNDRLKAAARLAMQRGWYDRAIFTLAKTGYWDDLELRFPLEHAALVEENANRHGIDIAWVFAVMRQESAFMRHARSHAGAVGLMQLMPATARHVARSILNRKPPHQQDLLRPETNIALGSAYLKHVKDELGDSAVLATAAYNAGPHRVTRWLPERTLPADIWIELVPFEETRGYLRRVLAYTVIYEKRMGKTPTRLTERLHPVPPNLTLLLGEQPDGRPASAS